MTNLKMKKWGNKSKKIGIFFTDHSVCVGGKKPAAYGGTEVVAGAHPSIFGSRGCESESVSACAGSPQLMNSCLTATERNNRLWNAALWLVKHRCEMSHAHTHVIAWLHLQTVAVSHGHDRYLQTSLVVFGNNCPFGRLRDSDLPPHGPLREMVEKLDSVTQVPQLMTKVPAPFVLIL